MATSERSLKLVVPGLLGPMPGLQEPVVSPFGADVAEELLAKADQEDVAASGLEATLFNLFGVEPDSSRDLPVAAVARIADVGKADLDWWLRADPVHLRADQNRLLLFDSRALAVTSEEAQGLVQSFNALFAPDGFHLEAPHPERWYLRLGADPGIRTHSLPDVVGRDVHAFLPFGENARSWHAILNEIQMLMHGSLANQTREQAGRPEINSVWFWGGGVAPKKVSAPCVQVWSEHPLAIGLARLASVPVSRKPESAPRWLEKIPAPGAHLVLIEDLNGPVLYGDVHGWIDSVMQVNQKWFTPVLHALKRGDVAAIEIYPCDGRVFRLRAGALRRFWRRRRPLAVWMRKASRCGTASGMQAQALK